ncbi:LOW QUALITY PROTEIN: hypothetical protein HID58_034491 [Brassica napus]|uniref:Uncharacterized protein n=1 Tax=Brassica napus TaxID=3708 RepID=A0ABQ8C3V1_BRANA|nr:LOW QUALITY PROTEIN: hypothetical protein HID58_034491 [Brassica napus]
MIHNHIYLCMEQKKISYLEATVCARPSCRSILSLNQLNLLMAPLVISSFQSQLRPPSRLRTPSPPSVSTPPSVSFVSTPPSDSESRLHPPTPLIRLCNPSLPSRLRPASHLSRPRPASPPSKLQVHPPPDPPPCTYPPVLPEARSPPKPPDPPDVPFNLVLLLIDGVISLVCVDDTSFVSKCFSPAVCSVFLYWCVDWSLHRFSPRDFIYPPLPFIMLVIVVVDSTMGCSIPIPNSIFVSLPLPLIQVLFQRLLNLILGDELISLVWYLELSFDLSLFFALVRPFTAVCSPFTTVCSSISVVFKSLCAQWQLNGLMPHISIHHVNRVVYCPVSAFMEFVLLPISSSTLCGFGVGNVLLKIRDTSNTEVLIKCFVAMLKIVDCALVAASILGFISLPVVTNFQGFILLYSSMVAEIRGLLDIISCLSALYAPIFLCCICFLVISVCCLPWMALYSCMHTFSIYGE